MGVCLCKEKVNHNNDNDDDNYTRNNHIASSTGVINGGEPQCVNNENYNIILPNQPTTRTTTTILRKLILAEQIDQLVEETLDIIGTIVEKYIKNYYLTK